MFRIAEIGRFRIGRFPNPFRCIGHELHNADGPFFGFPVVVEIRLHFDNSRNQKRIDLVLCGILPDFFTIVNGIDHLPDKKSVAEQKKHKSEQQQGEYPLFPQKLHYSPL